MQTWSKATWHTADLVPLVDGKVVVTSDSDNGRYRHSGVSVGSNVSHWRVGQELHDHTDIILDCCEHHWRLHTNNTQYTSLLLHRTINDSQSACTIHTCQWQPISTHVSMTANQHTQYTHLNDSQSTHNTQVSSFTGPSTTANQHAPYTRVNDSQSAHTIHTSQWQPINTHDTHVSSFTGPSTTVNQHAQFMHLFTRTSN